MGFFEGGRTEKKAPAGHLNLFLEIEMKLEDTFKFRNAWMGFAILWVMLLHSGLNIDAEPLHTFKRLGFAGVDIFLFASGLGCSYSLNKNPDIISFLKRRAVRVLPTWWTFLIIWWLCHGQMKIDWSWQAFFGNFFLVQAFIDWRQCFNWYVSAMLITYLLAPYCFELTERKMSWRAFAGVEFILLLMCLPYLNHDYLILISRLPIFFAGFYIARLARQGAVITRQGAIGLAIAFLIGSTVLTFCMRQYPEQLLTDLGLWWYPFLLITPGLCLGMSLVLSRAPLLNKILSTVGALSFEIYLMHLGLLYLLIVYPPSDNIGWLGWIAASMAGGAALKLFVSKIIRREA